MRRGVRKIESADRVIYNRFHVEPDFHPIDIATHRKRRIADTKSFCSAGLVRPLIHTPKPITLSSKIHNRYQRCSCSKMRARLPNTANRKDRLLSPGLHYDFRLLHHGFQFFSRNKTYSMSIVYLHFTCTSVKIYDLTVTTFGLTLEFGKISSCVYFQP